MLEHDNLEEFCDGELYDATNALKEIELEFLAISPVNTGVLYSMLEQALLIGQRISRQYKP